MRNFQILEISNSQTVGYTLVLVTRNKQKWTHA